MDPEFHIASNVQWSNAKYINPKNPLTPPEKS